MEKCGLFQKIKTEKLQIFTRKTFSRHLVKKVGIKIKLYGKTFI